MQEQSKFKFSIQEGIIEINVIEVGKIILGFNRDKELVFKEIFKVDRIEFQLGELKDRGRRFRQ